MHARLRTRVRRAWRESTLERTHADSAMRLRRQDSTKYSLPFSRPGIVSAFDTRGPVGMVSAPRRVVD